MTTLDTETRFPLIVTHHDTRTYYRYVIKSGRKFYTLEQWCLSQVHAEETAVRHAPNYGPRARVLLVYPVPAGVKAGTDLVCYTGGP